MTFAYWCLLFSIFMPYIFTGLAKFGDPNKKFDNNAPREFLEKQEGWQKRAHWAQLNHFEAFPPFAAALLVAHQMQGNQSTINLLAVSWVVLRLFYGMCYIKDWANLRSLVWAAALLVVVALFVTAM